MTDDVNHDLRPALAVTDAVAHDTLKSVEGGGMKLQQANYLGSGDRLEILAAGLERHDIGTADAVGAYVSQFESPKRGRLIIVRVDNGEAYGFQLDEVKLLGRRSAC